MSSHTAVASLTLLPLLQQHHLSTLQTGRCFESATAHRGGLNGEAVQNNTTINQSERKWGS
eukprot:scaffold19122_cov23-Cyclotella_meneghiniana.AAC.3